MRKANSKRTWVVVAMLGVAVLATMACEGSKSTYPTQPAANNLNVPETTVVSADFTATVVSGLKTVLFSSAVLGNVTNYRWDFGDGGKSSAVNPSHTYKKFGTYVVSLRVSNRISSDTVSKFITISETESETATAPEGDG